MNNRDMNQDGVGLGLTISKNIANALGGDIKVQSEVGVGSQFTLILPSKLDEKQESDQSSIISK